MKPTSQMSLRGESFMSYSSLCQEQSTHGIISAILIILCQGNETQGRNWLHRTKLVTWDSIMGVYFCLLPLIANTMKLLLTIP